MDEIKIPLKQGGYLSIFKSWHDGRIVIAHVTGYDPVPMDNAEVEQLIAALQAHLGNMPHPPHDPIR